MSSIVTFTLALSLYMSGIFVGEDYAMYVGSNGLASISWVDDSKATVLFTRESTNPYGNPLLTGHVQSSTDRNKMTVGDIVMFTQLPTGAYLLAVMTPGQTRDRWHNTACWQGYNLQPNQHLIPDGFGSCTLFSQ